MKTSILVPVGAIGALVAAVVLASPMTTEIAATPAMTPNRAEVFAVADCGAPAIISASDQQAWHSALGKKRALERDLILAGGTSDLAKGCAPSGD
jgi:streptogramin lyase